MLAALSAACGDEPAGDAAARGDFCRQVQPLVRAWVEEASRETPEPSGDRYGGTAVVGSIGELAGGMNALTSPDYAATQHQQHVNLMTLVRFDGDLSLRPYLAESWELADDGRTLTFHLRRDVYWHDGERTDAHDVAFTFARATDPATGFPNPVLWDGYAEGPDALQVVDDFTVAVRLEPHAEPLEAWRTVAIMPEHLLGDVPPAELAQHPFGSVCPVGNGPFVFVSHRAQDRWVFEANPAFPEALGGRPHLDRYVYRSVPDGTALLTDLLTGGVDMLIAPRPEQAQAILDASDLELRRYPFRNLMFIAWNSRRPQLRDRRVRRAITMAVDRQLIVDALLEGYGSVAHGRVPPFHWAYDPGSPGSPEFDPSAARALLTEAGWADRDGDGVRENAGGLDLAITIKSHTASQQRAQVAELVQAQLADVGISVDIQLVEWGTLLEQINDADRRDFDGVVMAFVTEFRIDDTDLFHSERIDEPFAWAGMRSATLDRLLEELRGATDRARARELWAAYNRVLNEEQPWTMLYFPDRMDGVNRRLRDVVVDARGEWVNVHEWWLEPGAR